MNTMVLPPLPKLLKMQYKSSPELLKREYERLLPEIRKRLKDQDLCRAKIKMYTSDCGDNIRFLEHLCVDLKRRLEDNKLIGFEMMDITRKYYLELEKCLRVGIREVDLRLGRIDHDKAMCTTDDELEDLEDFREQILMKKLELTNMYAKFDDEYCDEVLNENRQELFDTVLQLRKDIHEFKMEVMAGRIAHDRIFKHFLIEKLPSTFINVTLDDFANGQIDTFNNNCRRVLASVCRGTVEIHRGLIRWNARSVGLREEMDEFDKELKDLDGLLKKWNETIIMIARLCHHLRQDRKAFEEKNGVNKK